MTSKPNLTRIVANIQEAAVGNKIDQNNIQSTGVQPKVVIQPVPGQIYISTDDGRLVPVDTSMPIVVSPTKQSVTSIFKPKVVPLNSQTSVSEKGNHVKESQIKITKAISLAPKQQHLISQQSGSSNTTNSLSEKGESELITGINENIVLKINKRYDNDSEIPLLPKKKFKSGDSNIKPQQNLKLSTLDTKIDDNQLMEQEESNLETAGDTNLSDTSLAGSVEGEYTTPEYLYDELLDNDYIGDECEVIEEETIDNSEIEYPEISGTQFNEVNHEEEETCTKVSSSPVKNSQQASKKSIVEEYSLTPDISTEHSSKSNSIAKCGETNPPIRYLTPKAPRINDKFPELPVPHNINQYGDCLKTRLGRYHYGLTLNDPPCQFFQGVLKGASGQTLAAMFGDTNLISKFRTVPLEEIGHFAIDSTFRVIPESTTGVDHVLTINLLFKNQNIPLWYAVTSCSSTELFKRILIEFQQHVLDWPFISILLNDDPALCKAVLAVFPDAELYGSWFYYCYSIWKELCFNNLATSCKTDITLMTAVKMLMVVPYLPPVTDTPSSITMVEGFEVVRQFARDNNLPKEFSKVTDYVATFWFNIVKTKNFTVFGKHTSALNYIEIFQLSLLSYMKPGGNVWTLTHSFQSVARTANTEFNRYLNGKPFAAKKNRGKKFNVTIRQNTRKLMMGTSDVRTFLEKSTVYCEEMLDIFLHPLYPTTTSEKSNFIHTEGWKIKIIDK